MGKYIKLSPEQKDEIRRLTQLANRRIKQAQKTYGKEGMTVLPKSVVGKYQSEEKWNTKSTPISRSVRFETRSEYVKQLKYLREFENNRPTITEYTQVQREKTKLALESSFGVEVHDDLNNKIDKMSAPQLARFWKEYSRTSTKMVMNYSSDSAMSQTMSEFFGEDISGLSSKLIRKTG